MLNAVGDVVLTDPEAMRALAEPARLELLDRLRRAGPSSTDDLAVPGETTPSSVAADLNVLERFDLVESDGSTWTAVGKGVFFEIPEDPSGQTAARALARAMYLRSAGLPPRWITEGEPRLELEWARAAGLFSARPIVTRDELREIQDELEGLIAPYLAREPRDAPEGARRVRVLSYFMPEPPDG